MSTTALSKEGSLLLLLLKARSNKASGGYGVMVSAPVCGTGCSGSIPGSRPNENDTFFTLPFLTILVRAKHSSSTK